ncbi:kinase-like domain-containing protein [Sparassis latifolia]
MAHSSSALPNVSSPGDLYSVLRPSEIYWRDRQVWLEQRGYMLRQRYRVDWKPSWETRSKKPYNCEDSVTLMRSTIIDATRTSDGSIVALKKVSKSAHPHEAEIGQFFSGEPLRSDAQNRCISIHEVLQDPIEEDFIILVMPFLRVYNDPRFDTVGEAVDFFRQIFSALQFMHHNHVAHRDCMTLNIMMDPIPMYPQLYHPVSRSSNRNFTRAAKRYTRTQRPTKYYLVDFGLSRKYNPDDGPPEELPILGGDKSAPEFQGEGYDVASDPFPTDIYYLGNVILQDFLWKYYGLEFMNGLVADMVQQEPKKRPTIDQVISRFDDIWPQLSSWKLRSELVRKHDDVLLRFFKIIRHVYRTVKYVAGRLPPLPTP